MVAGGDEAYGAAGIQQGVDRANRLAAVVGEDDHVARRAGELGSAGHRAHLGELAVKGALCGDGDAVKAAHGGEVGNRLGVQIGEAGGGGVGALPQDGVGVVPLGLMHVHHQGTGPVGDAAHGGVRVQRGYPYAVAQQEPAHRIGVGGIALGGGVHGDDIVLGEIIVVLLVGDAPGIGLQLLVVHIHIPLFHAVPVIFVLDAPAEELQLVVVDVVLVLHDVVDQAVDAVLEQVGGCLVVIGGLNGVAQGAAVEHGVAGAVVGTQVVPSGPVHGGGVVVIPQRHVIGPVQGVGMLLPGGRHGAQGSRAEGLGAQRKVLHQQVVFQVGLVGRGAGLHQEFGHVAVQLGEYHRVPVVDHLDQIGSLVLGLVGGVPVQIKAVVVAAGVVGAPVRVLIGADDKDDVVQNVVHLQRDVAADGIELTGIVDAGVVLNVALRIPGELLGAQAGDAQVQHVGGEHLRDVHTLVLEAGEGVVGNGLLCSQGAQDVELGVHAGILVGVDVVEEEGHAVVAHGALLQLVLEGGGGGLGDGVHGLECVHGRLAVGQGDVILVPAALALAEGGDGDVPAGERLVDDVLDGLVNVVVADIAVIGIHRHVRLRHYGITAPGGQGVRADETGPGVPVFGGVAVDAGKGTGGKGQGHGDLAAAGRRGCIAQGEQCVASFAVVPDLPAVQAVAGVVIGIERPVLEALLPGEVPGKAGGPGIGRGVPQYRGVYGEGGGKVLIPVNQSERRIRNGEYGRGGRFGRGGNGADGKQHAQSQEKGEGPDCAVDTHGHGRGLLHEMWFSSFLHGRNLTAVAAPESIPLPVTVL